MSTATITAADINKLRQATGAGMMDCRKALMETNGDFEAAIDWLRKKGAKVAALRGDREAREGVVIARTTGDNKTGIAFCVSCETDFVSKNELNSATIDGAKIADLVNDKLASIGEKIGITKFERIDAPFVSSYIHGANRIGVLVGFNKPVTEAGKDVAMQIAAMNPLAVDADSVPANVVERERAIVTEQIKADPKMAGKPAEMIAKIADGKLNAFFKEQTLMAQPFVKDAAKSVADQLKAVDSTLKVTEFRRVALG